MSYHRGDVYDLLPESFATVLMVPEAVGTWLLHCHVNVHNIGGMNGLFTVMDPTGNLLLISGKFITDLRYASLYYDKSM